MAYNTLYLLLLNTFIFLIESLAWLELWQRKEYRLDRLKSSFTRIEWLLVNRQAAFLLLIILQQPSLATASSLAFHLLIFLTRGIFRPKFTLKIKVIALIHTAVSLALLALWLQSGVSHIYAFSFLVMMAPFTVSASVTAGNMIGRWQKRRVIKLAIAYRASLPRLHAIGITGSWGKTSVKHFAGQLIPSAIVSDLRRNEEFVIAQDLLAHLNRNAPLYITEMAAYRRGEIADLCRLVRPRTGLITAIGNQHLSLFGTPENIFLAKRELIDALPQNGTAILNADDAQLSRLAGQISLPVLLYSIKKPADVFMKNSIFHPFHTTTTLQIKNKTFPVKIPVPGEAALSNVCAALTLAWHVGENVDRLVSRLSHLKPLARTLEIKPGPNNSVVIDDSYSSSEASVLGAIKHLARFPHRHKKVLLLPLIELGIAAPQVHRRIAEQLVALDMPAHIFGTAFRSEFTASLAPGQLNQFSFHTRPNSFAQAAMTGLNADSVILIAGRIPESVRQNLLTPTCRGRR